MSNELSPEVYGSEHLSHVIILEEETFQYGIEHTVAIITDLNIIKSYLNNDECTLYDISRNVMNDVFKL